MIAIVTSTLAPAAHSYFSSEKRIEQTLYTIQRLIDVGFTSIYLFDNSTERIKDDTIFSSFPSVKTYYCPQYTFNNKGLNEALLILNNLHNLPENTPIFKISARYYPSPNFEIANYKNYPEKDLIGVGKISDGTSPFFSTRAYYVKNKKNLELMLVFAIEEMLSYSKGIHGVRSLFENIKSYFSPYIGTKYQLSLEQAIGRILKNKRNFHLLDKIGIEGYIAGSDRLEFISE